MDQNRTELSGNIERISCGIEIMKITAAITFLVCLTGFGVQLTGISQRYFSYSTRSYVNIYVADNLPLPGVSTCWSLGEIVDFSKLNKKYSLNRLQGSKYDWKYLYDILANETAENLFKATPSNETFFDKNPACAIRFPDHMSWRHPWYNREECLAIVKVEKYLNRLNMCYKISFKNDNGRLNLKHVTSSPSNPGYIYMMFLNPKLFDRKLRYTAFAHSVDSSPLFDSVFSIEKTINVDGKFRIGIQFVPMSLTKLPPPFDTMCHHGFVKFKSGTEYNLHQLNLATMAEMKHVHTLGHVHDKYKFPILSSASFRNITIHAQFMKLFKVHTSVFYPVCRLEYNVPKTRLEEYERTSFVVYWPQDSGVDVQKVADQLLIDFVIYVCSSIGVWLGLSVFSVMNIMSNFVSNKFGSQPEIIPNIIDARSIFKNRRDIESLKSSVRKMDQKLTVCHQAHVTSHE